MPSDFVQKIPPQIIKVPDGWREVDPEVVDQIVRSLPDRGLLQAIGVRPDPDEPGGFLLVFGRHRLEAHAKLGLETIDCRILDVDDEDAEVVTAIENLFRAPLKGPSISSPCGPGRPPTRPPTPNRTATRAEASAGESETARPKSPMDQRQLVSPGYTSATASPCGSNPETTEAIAPGFAREAASSMGVSPRRSTRTSSSPRPSATTPWKSSSAAGSRTPTPARSASSPTATARRSSRWSAPGWTRGSP